MATWMSSFNEIGYGSFDWKLILPAVAIKDSGCQNVSLKGKIVYFIFL
jgi:hypothetical protein